MRNDAILYSDGGGKTAAALNPIYGADRIARFFLGISRKFPPSHRAEAVTINGRLGMVLIAGDELHSVIGFDVAGGLILAVYIVRNPDRLREAARLLGVSLAD